MDYKLQVARASCKKIQLVNRTNDVDNNVGIGKRKMLVGDFIPDPKKQNVGNLLCLQNHALTCKSSKSEDMFCPGDSLEGEDVGRFSTDFGKRLDLGDKVRSDLVNSVKIVDNIPHDFRCIICKKLPKRLNRSELYRHYVETHFYTKLMKEFGHIKTCPVCKVDLKRNSIPSHFGQKHSHVEHYLPVEAWISMSKVGVKISRGRTGRGDKDDKERPNRVRTNGELKKVENKVNSLKEDSWVWPEIPEGFNHNGHERGVKSVFQLFKQPFRIATVNGFDIELVIEEKQKNLVDCSEMCSPLASAHKQVMQCRICKKRFSTKLLVVLHVQADHGMKGPGDEVHDFDALLRSGDIAKEQILEQEKILDEPAVTMEGIDALKVLKTQSSELSYEEV